MTKKNIIYFYNRNYPMAEFEIHEHPQIKGFYFEGFSSYPFHLYRDRLVVYDYDNQEEHVIDLSHDQVLAFLMNVINKTRHLEIDRDAEYDGTWLSGTLDEATRKYNAMIEANNAEARAAAGPPPDPPAPAEGGQRHKRSGHKRSGHKRSGHKKRKSQNKRKSHKRSGHKRSGHKKSRRH